MMYNSPKMGHPNPQGSAPPGAPYGGQGGYPGPYGPRPSYSHNHYPPYGARPGMYPGSYGGPYPPQGWGSQGAVQNTPQGVTPNQPHHGNAKGTLGPRHGLLPQASPHFGGQRIPHPPGKGYPPGPPGSYNGPPGSTPAAIYNGPGTPGPAGQANNYSGGTNYTNSSPGNVASNFNSAAGSNGPPPGPSSANGPAASSKPSSPVTNTNNNPLPPTGPDGVPMLDETSQQSTLSQSSDRSDGTTGGRQTPKTSFVPQGGPGGSYPSHHQGGPPGSPHRSAPSPGLDGGYGSGSGGNPGWQNQHRIASSPAGTASGPSSHSMFNSITPGSLPASTVGPPGSARGPPSTSSSPSPGPPMTSGVGGVCGTETKTSAPPTPGSKAAKAAAARTEGLMRLYEMDDHPERKMFLDKLLGFMEERGTAIAQCPTISKNPLDLFKLYIYTKEKGGFMEVSQHLLPDSG